MREMANNDDKDDLIIPTSIDEGSNVEYLSKLGLLPAEVQNIRTLVHEFDPKTLDRYDDGLVYSAYCAALKCDGFNKSSIYKYLGVSKRLFDYYMKTYPKFNAAVNLGFADKQEQLKTSLVKRLYTLAEGIAVEDTSEVEESMYDADNNFLGKKVKKGTKVTHIPPDVKAITALLSKLDESWNPKLQVDVSGNVTNLNVTADVDIAVDYKQLSVSTMKELLGSQKNANIGLESKFESSKRLESDLNEVPENIKKSRLVPQVRIKEAEVENVKAENKNKLNLLLGVKENGKKSKRNDKRRKV